MNLKEGCAFLENLELITVTILDTNENINSFCESFRIHSTQKLYNPKELTNIISEINKDEFLLINDPFKIRVLFAKINGIPVAYGPYCTELLSIEEISLMLSHLKVKDIEPESLAKQRSRYTVKPQQNVQYYLNVLISKVTGNDTIHNVRTLSFSPLSNNDDYEIVPREMHIRLVREHYANEQHLINSISEGNFNEAFKTWRILHKAVSYAHIGHTIEMSRVSAGITRTLLRIGAINAGIPAEINDRISGNSSQIILKARTIDAINAEHERLIKEYCDIVKEYTSNKYSRTVIGIKYFIENEYDKPICLEDIANELDCSSSQLIHSFKKEMGTTPIAYLNQVRMKKAAKKLLETKNPIQEIAETVGILDSNYFVKCFKKVYGITPTAYRKKYS